MSEINWIGIINNCIVLIVPLVTTYWLVKTMRETANPAKKQPSALIKPERMTAAQKAYLRWSVSLFLPCLSVFIYFYLDNEPTITWWKIAIVCFNLIMFNFALTMLAVTSMLELESEITNSKIERMKSGIKKNA